MILPIYSLNHCIYFC